MKFTHLIFLLIFTGTASKSNATTQEHSIFSFYTTIDNGWYAATVQYSNYSTGTNATYTLDVKVEYNKVTTIDFGNGGSVHTGYNSEGYIYSGGNLSFEKDFYGNITSATTTVTVSDSNGIRYYKIKIQ